MPFNAESRLNLTGIYSNCIKYTVTIKCIASFKLITLKKNLTFKHIQHIWLSFFINYCMSQFLWQINTISVKRVACEFCGLSGANDNMSGGEWYFSDIMMFTCVHFKPVFPFSLRCSFNKACGLFAAP